MRTILYIDTSDSQKILLKLQTGGIVKEISSHSRILRSEAALPLIDKLLKKNNLDVNDLSEIKVILGQGSFTGLRVGASIANTLSYLLKIPVNSKEIGDLVQPVYNK